MQKFPSSKTEGATTCDEGEGYLHKAGARFRLRSITETLSLKARGKAGTHQVLHNEPAAQICSSYKQENDKEEICKCYIPSTTRSQNNRQLSQFYDQPILNRFLPIARIVPINKLHIKPLNEECNNHAHLDEREVPTCAVGRAVGEGYEGSSVRVDLVRSRFRGLDLGLGLGSGVGMGSGGGAGELLWRALGGTRV